MAVTVASFKDYFDRGQFTYGADLPSIRDKDITQALAEATAVINLSLYPDDATADLALLYLTAHFLQTDTDAADSGGAANFPQTSRSADGLSESVEVPAWMKDGIFSVYASTYYGVKYSTMTYPYIGGAVFVVGGRTLP